MKKTPTQLNTVPASRKNKGFSLVEVLVAMVVLSIGLLGLAGLQTASLKANDSAYQRSQASILANEIIDRIRANRAGLENGNYNNPYASTPSDPGCSATGCTPATMAQYDVYYWETSLGNLLPGGKGDISGNGLDSIFTIKVMWDDKRSGATKTDCTSASDQLTCFVMNTSP